MNCFNSYAANIRQLFESTKLFLLNFAVLSGKKYFYHFIYYSHEVFISLAMSRNFHFFAMHKAMSPLHKTKVMKKKTEKFFTPS